jgi:D-alanyl-lipoteichoic acid acyltransferase DltB (MBOAT superfamily)
VNLKIPSLNIPLPLGIYFFTFHVICYPVDVYCSVARFFAH